MRNSKKYPKNWRELSTQCKERAEWRCTSCGVEHGTPRRSPWTGREWPVYLQAAHIDHNPDCAEPALTAVCPRCHWRFYRKPGQPAAWMIESLKHRRLLAGGGVLCSA